MHVTIKTMKYTLPENELKPELSRVSQQLYKWHIKWELQISFPSQGQLTNPENQCRWDPDSGGSVTHTFLVATNSPRQHLPTGTSSQPQPQPDKYLPLKSSPSKSWGICVWVLWGLFFKLEKSLRTTCALTPKTVPQTKAYYWETVKELMLQLSLKVSKVLQVTPLSNVATVFGCNVLQQNRNRSQAERR